MVRLTTRGVNMAGHARSFIAALWAVGVIFGVSAAGASAAQLPVPYGSAALADFAANELFDPTALAGGNNGCKPTAAHPYPVVLVHGTFENEGSNWVTLSPLLANAGYCVYAFNYGATLISLGRIYGLGDIATSAQQLANFVDQVLAETGASKVDIVGHSQGGMMPNYYLKFLGGASKVNELIGLAPSNHGTTLDGLVKLEQVLPPILQKTITAALSIVGTPSLPQQEIGSQFITNLFAGGDTVAGPRYVVIETSHDEVVTPYTNAFLTGPNVTDILVQNQCPGDTTGHVGMDFDGPAMQDVLNQLAQWPDPNFVPSCTNYGVGF